MSVDELEQFITSGEQEQSPSDAKGLMNEEPTGNARTESMNRGQQMLWVCCRSIAPDGTAYHYGGPWLAEITFACLTCGHQCGSHCYFFFC